MGGSSLSDKITFLCQEWGIWEGCKQKGSHTNTSQCDRGAITEEIEDREGARDKNQREIARERVCKEGVVSRGSGV